MKVCLDAGHGGLDAGAVGKISKEKDLTLAITLLTAGELNKLNISSVLTRDKDAYVTLEKRCQIANQNKVDAFISIHINSATNSQAKGFEVYCFSEQSNGYRLAKTIEGQYLQNVKEISIDRGVKTANFYVIRYTNMPAVLVECGFISNVEEEKTLNNYETQRAIAKAIAEGIKKYSIGG